jgi:capsular polysaccharide transport system permease protein
MSDKQSGPRPSAALPIQQSDRHDIAEAGVPTPVTRHTPLESIGDARIEDEGLTSQVGRKDHLVETPANESVSTQQDVLAAAAPNEARRLVVVPGQKQPGVPDQRPGPPRRGPVAAQPNRPAPTAVPAARGPANIPAKVAPSELEAWPAFEQVASLTTMRLTRRRRFFGRLALLVGLPTLLMALYAFLWATPRYVSEFELTYQSYQNTQTLSSGLVQTLLGSSQGGSDFGTILYEYIRSDTLLKKLDQKLALRKYYSSHDVDYPVRLNADASDEAFLSYYRRHVVDVSEGLGGYVTVDVQAFDAVFAQTLAKAIAEACDEMADEMTTRARQDGMKFAEEEVARQEDRVRNAQIAETKFQNEHRDLNPTNTATQFGVIVGSLETQLSQTRTALTNTLSYASPNAPQVQQLKNQIAAIEAQLQDQRNRLTGSGDKTYSQILEEYSRLQIEQQFAQNAYLSAQQGLAVARADAARKQNYLVDFVAPNHPSGPTRTFYITYLAAAFLGSLFLYGIGSLVAGAFRDQAGL